jgi:hypothetical protein
MPICREMFPWSDDSLDSMELYGHMYDLEQKQWEAYERMYPGVQPVPIEVDEYFFNKHN